MELTSLVAKVVGPVLVLRAASILLDRAHFAALVRGLEREVTTVAFSAFPIAPHDDCDHRTSRISPRARMLSATLTIRPWAVSESLRNRSSMAGVSSAVTTWTAARSRRGIAGRAWRARREA
jgi:hypothetical protein